MEVMSGCSETFCQLPRNAAPATQSARQNAELRLSNDANDVSGTVNYQTLFSSTVLLLLAKSYTPAYLRRWRFGVALRGSLLAHEVEDRSSRISGFSRNGSSWHGRRGTSKIVPPSSWSSKVSFWQTSISPFSTT